MIYTVKEVAYMLDKPEKWVHTYCTPKRKSLIKDENKMIDTAIDSNRTFINKHQVRELDGTQIRVHEEKTKIEEKPKKSTSGAKKTPVKKEVKEPVVRVVNEQVELLNAFDRRKQELQLEKMEKEAKLLDLKLERELGDYVSVPDVVNALRHKTTELNKIFLIETERYIQKICDREEIEISDAITYKKGVVELLNKIMKNAESKTLTKL